MNARELLQLQAATLFVLSRDGRIVRSNDPEHSDPPRMYLAGCETGCIVRLRDDVDARTSKAIEDLVAQEPPMTEPGATPRFAERYRELLHDEAPLTAHNYGPVHCLPHGTPCPGDAATVCQGTAEGDALWDRLATHGLSKSMVDMGFLDLTHFWEPWCVALIDGEIASIAFAARLGDRAAEIGVATMPQFRGRRLAAAVTAAWSALPMLQQRTLFYSTHRDNLASQRVIAQLGLPFIGASMRIP
jgi:hypothetical protein